MLDDQIVFIFEYRHLQFGYWLLTRRLSRTETKRPAKQGQATGNMTQYSHIESSKNGRKSGQVSLNNQGVQSANRNRYLKVGVDI